MKTTTFPCKAVIVILQCALLLAGPNAPAEEALLLAKGGESLVPIILSAEAPGETSIAAGDLADYLYKISGARPDVLKGAPEPRPPRAIWVGDNPLLEDVFPAVALEFSHPEEILMVCDGENLLLTGRGAGAPNAVYTFLRDFLDVRWLWPGELGEVYPRKDAVSVAPFENREHPFFMQRDIMRMNPHRGAVKSHRDPLVVREEAWRRRQRALNRSMRGPASSHAFKKWWQNYHEEHPDYFALQPDGSRSGYPSPVTAKLCFSNPGVWERWMELAAEKIESSPEQSPIVIAAAPNDSYSSGNCVCENCRAWDHPDGMKFNYSWKGKQEEYVAMSDRYVRFWNKLAGLLKERYPQRDDIYVIGHGYGVCEPAPVEAVAEDNVMIYFVGHFPLAAGSVARERMKSYIVDWKRSAKRIFYRPNLFYCGGGVWGFPEVDLAKTDEDFKFLADLGCLGVVVDTVWSHWATQGPQYYLMQQLAWDPLQDGAAVMSDYYNRGFGPAAGEIAAYWDYMAELRDSLVDHPEYSFGSRHALSIAQLLATAYSPEAMLKAGVLLDEAAAKTEGGEESYARRVRFVRAGFDFVNRMVENVGLMERARKSGGRDYEAVFKVVANWEETTRVSKEEYPYSINDHVASERMTKGYMSGVWYHFGPPPEGMLRTAEEARLNPQAAAKPVEYKAVPAQEAGWTKEFEDDFKREAIGPDWKAPDGWKIEDGCLTGSGTLLLNRSFKGFQRIEFEASSRPFSESAKQTGEEREFAGVSDLSSMLHITESAEEGNLHTGYFLQFGGMANTRNLIKRRGEALWMDMDPDLKIEPGKVHRIIVENDTGRIRLIVDDRLVHETQDNKSLAEDESRDRVGFYFHTPVELRSVRVFTKPLDDGMI